LLQAVIRNNVAYTHMDVGELDQALRSAELSLAYCESHQCPYLHTGVLDTIAAVHTRRGDLDEAREFCRRGIALAQRIECDPDLTNSLLSLSRIEALEGHWPAALDAAERALALAESRGMGVEEYQCHELISQIYEQQGECREALHHYRRFHQLRQARVDAETASRLTLLRVEHQVDAARKDAEILRLRSLALEQEVEERKIAQAEAEANASLDALTGLFNRRHVPVLAQRLTAALEAGHPSAVALFDIDYFKVLNDTYGHVTGDQVLRAVAEQLSLSARRSDTVCRLGGDEFLVLFVDMSLGAAEAATARIRESVAACLVDRGGGLISVTVSAGLVGTRARVGIDLDALIKEADAALYEAKRSGRNKLVVRSL
jgi:diguanylate cyclase (GGDEF)-like protein